MRARGQKKEEETNTDSREEVILQLREQLKEQEARIRELQGQLEEVSAMYREAADTVLAIRKLAGSFQA